MVLPSAGALKRHKRDVHQAEVKVQFMGDNAERILTRDENGDFKCPLAGCPLVTKKPGTIQAHCKTKLYVVDLDVAEGKCIPEDRLEKMKIITCWLGDVVPRSATAPEPDRQQMETHYLEFSSFSLAYHMKWSLYSCLKCEKGISPREIDGHMRKQHGIKSNSERNKELTQILRLYPGRNPGSIEVCIIPATIEVLSTFLISTFSGHNRLLTPCRISVSTGDGFVDHVPMPQGQSLPCSNTIANAILRKLKLPKPLYNHSQRELAGAFLL